MKKFPFHWFFFLSFFSLFFAAEIKAQNNKAALIQVSVGFPPNLWFAQPAVIKGEGWDKEAGLDLNLVRFAGPQMVLQAFAAGQIDMMYDNIGASLTPPTRGISTRILASTIKDDIFLVARPSLSKFHLSGTAADAIRAFVKENKRKVKISTNPKGSLSDLILRYWLDHTFEKPYDFVEVINTGSQDQFQQSILNGEVDAASIFEPLYTIAHHLDSGITIFAQPSELMADQPGGAVSVMRSYAEQHPDLIKKLIALHIRATQFLRDHPAEAAKDVFNHFGKGLVSVEIYEKAIRFDHDRFVSDPSTMIASTKIIHDYMRKTGYLTQDVNLEELFDLKDYKEVVSGEKK